MEIAYCGVFPGGQNTSYCSACRCLPELDSHGSCKNRIKILEEALISLQLTKLRPVNTDCLGGT